LRNNAKKDTYRHKKESFPDLGEERNRFCVKGKKFVSNPLRYIASSSQKNQVFTFASR
jgi:hypothetical protein